MLCLTYDEDHNEEAGLEARMFPVIISTSSSEHLWGVYTIQQTSSKLRANVFKIHALILDVCCHML